MKFLILSCLIAGSLALNLRPAPYAYQNKDCPKYPDNTETKFYWANCGTGDIITTSSITLTDGTGKANYPVNVNKPIVITAQSNNGGGTYKTLKADVDLYSWGGWLGCSWHSIPTFGFLNNLDGCSIGKNCPLQPGAMVLHESVDLSKFASIISSLVSDATYRIDIHVKNGDDSQHEELDCIRVEARLLKS
jgi:hypothetical protein